MTLSTPVIAADIGGLGSLVKQSIGGVAVQYDDHSAYIDAIEQLLENQEMASTMGALGRKYVKNHLTWGKNIKQLVSMRMFLERRINAPDQLSNLVYEP